MSLRGSARAASLQAGRGRSSFRAATRFSRAPPPYSGNVTTPSRRQCASAQGRERLRAEGRVTNSDPPPQIHKLRNLPALTRSPSFQPSVTSAPLAHRPLPGRRRRRVRARGGTARRRSPGKECRARSPTANGRGPDPPGWRVRRPAEPAASADPSAGLAARGERPAPREGGVRGAAGWGPRAGGACSPASSAASRDASDLSPAGKASVSAPPSLPAPPGGGQGLGRGG